ncbi:hypothetical protein J0H33_02790 [bacterium]|nr:hypothetical protein [bacterium]
MQVSKPFLIRRAAAAAATLSALVATVVAVTAAAAQTASPSDTPSTTPATSPTSTATASATATREPACNGTLLNGFLIMHNNENPNAFCPDFAPVTAAGPYTVYGLGLPTDQYRLVSASHPAHLPHTTTITYVPLSGVAEGEGYVTVSVTTTFKQPSVVNIPPGGNANSWAEARYLPEPGVANTSAGHSTAEWIGPGGLYTLSIDSAHSSLTLQQAAALLVPVDLSQLQASLTPTATVTPQPPATGNGTTRRSGDLAEIVLFAAGLLLLSLSAGIGRAVLGRRR